MEKEGIIGRIKIVMKKNADTANSFANKVGIDPSGFRKKLKGESTLMPKDILKICDATGVNREWLECGKGSMETTEKYVLDGPAYETNKEIVSKMIENAISRALSGKDSPLMGLFNVGNNSQNISTGADRAKEDKIASLEDKNKQLIEIINAKDETIRVLTALLKANNIDY